MVPIGSSTNQTFSRLQSDSQNSFIVACCKLQKDKIVSVSQEYERLLFPLQSVLFIKSKTLCTLGFKMCLGWFDHKWVALNTSVNDQHCDPITQTACRGGLEHIWPHIFCSVNTNVSWCVPYKEIDHQCRTWWLFWYQRASTVERLM